MKCRMMETLLAARRLLVAEDLPVANMNHAMRVFGDVVLVRDQNNGISLRVQAIKKCHDFDTRLGVEVTGRLVGQNYRRGIDQGARNRDALPLSSRQLVGLVIHSAFHAH